jgi:hypothetical protein
MSAHRRDFEIIPGFHRDRQGHLLDVLFLAARRDRDVLGSLDVLRLVGRSGLGRGGGGLGFGLRLGASENGQSQRGYGEGTRKERDIKGAASHRLFSRKR